MIDQHTFLCFHSYAYLLYLIPTLFLSVFQYLSIIILLHFFNFFLLLVLYCIHRDAPLNKSVNVGLAQTRPDERNAYTQMENAHEVAAVTCETSAKQVHKQTNM